MSRRAPLIAGLISLVLAVAAVLLLVLPKMSDVDEAQERLEGAQQDEVALQAELSRLQEAAENAPELRRELARFRRAVPPVADLPGLINLLQTAADVAGVDFFSISPGDPVATPEGDAAEVPASIQVIGGFFPVDEFLFRLETLQRASKVPGIAVTEGPDGLPQVQIQLEVRFYTTDTDAGPGAAVPGAPSATPSPGA
ncbi:MAG: type 4a pilus biogenesis protein PilO, partial [Actinomycetota bacterium]